MRTIEIRTAQNVSIEYELASLRDRAFAILIDSLIIMAFIFFVLFFIILLLPSVLGGANGELVLVILYLVSPVTGFILYQFFSEWLANGQSWGKKAVGIQVVRLDGKQPEATDYLLRALFHLVDTLLSSGILAAIVISSSAKAQRLGDLSANTTVIRRRSTQRYRLSDILRIESAEQYQPRYPEVRQLSEQDMLTVKNVLIRFQKYRNSAHWAAVHATAQRIAQVLQVAPPDGNPIEFLKTLLRDYIVLTR